MNKKILIDARMYGLENSGIGRYLINLIEELKKFNTKERFIVLLKKKYFDSSEFPENWTKVLADFGHYGFTEQIRLPNLLYKLNPDLVHFPHLNIPIFWKGKFVVTVHDLTMQRQHRDATTLPIPLYYAKRFPFLYASKQAILKSLKIITPTKFVAEDMVSYYKIDMGKIKVIYEGFESGVVSNSSDNTVLTKYSVVKPYFFYLGNAYPHKNLKRAIEAIALLNQKRKEKVYLVIGGSRNVFVERLNKIVNKLDVTDLVKQIGYVDDKDLAILNRNSVGFLYPSIAEGFGLQGLEAISAGTLLLCSNIRVFKEIYGDYSFYFNPFDFSAIASSMKYALELENDKRDKLIKASQKFIKKYSWQKMAKETLEVYNSLI